MQKGNTFQTSYIPEQFAIMNKILKLKENGEWDDGWKVIEIGSLRLKEENLPNYHQLSKSHLKATGDSEKNNNPHK